MSIFTKDYYRQIWGTIHRHDYCEGLAQRLINQYGKVKFLDVGTGCGYLIKLLNEHGAQAYGLDISEYAVANSHGNVVLGSVVDIPFKDNLFDVVHSQGLWGYFPEEDIVKAWNECKRVGKLQHHNIDYAPSPPEHQYLYNHPQSWWEQRMK